MSAGSPKKARPGQRAAYIQPRRDTAEIRQAAYDKLTPLQRLERLDLGGFIAFKQRIKISAQMLKASEKKAEKAKGGFTPPTAPAEPKKAKFKKGQFQLDGKPGLR